MSAPFKDLKVHCVDLGARAGMPDHWRTFSENLTIDAFEPDEDANDKGYRQQGGVRWFPFGLAATSETLPFYVTGVPSGSSLYPPNEELLVDYTLRRYWRVAEVRDLPFLTFSDFLSEHQRPKPELIKLDTQGSELDILASLKEDDWSQVIAVEAEVEFAELYSGQPLFRDIDAFMNARGFDLLDLRTHRAYVHREGRSDFYLRNYLNFATARTDFSARLLAGDALYIRRYPGGLPADVTGVRKLAFAFCVYRFFDQALALADKAHAAGLLDEADRASLIADIVQTAPRARAHEHTRGVLRRANTGLQHVLTKTMAAFGYRRPRRDLSLAGWSLRAWPDQ